MKRKDIVTLVLFFILLFVAQQLLARGGGGGGDGGGGGSSSADGLSEPGNPHHWTIFDYIIFIVVLIFGSFSSIFAFFVLWRSNVSKKLLQQICLKDSFWKLDEMELHAHNMFYKMQDAWGYRDIDRIQQFITPELHRKYKAKLDYLKMGHTVNIIRNINITKIKIIGCEKYKDDSKDRYIAYIKGTILDFKVDDRTGRTISNHEKETETFADTYHFVRVNNNWLLENIDNSVNVLDVVSARNFKEE